MRLGIAREGLLILVAAAVGIGAVGAYRLLYKNVVPLEPSIFAAEAKRTSKPSSTAREDRGIAVSPDQAQARPEQLDAQDRSTIVAAKAERQQIELEAELAEAKRQIDYLKRAKSPIPGPDLVATSGIANGQMPVAAASGSKSPKQPKPDAAIVERARIADLRQRADAFLKGQTTDRWASDGIGVWQACIDLQRGRLSNDGAGALLDICGELLSDGVRFLRANVGTAETAEVLKVARALRTEKSLLSAAQLKEVDRLLATFNAQIGANGKVKAGPG